MKPHHKRIYYLAGVLSSAILQGIVYPFVSHKWVPMVVVPIVLCATIVWNIEEGD